jgi:two-component system chemotaxis response regulator CheY
MHRILIIDDEPQVRDYIRTALKRSDLAPEVIEAEDGVKGLALASGLSDVSLFIVDYNMPGLNGLEVVERLLADERFRDKPIMLYTTETNPALVAKARALSKQLRWVIKPLQEATFVEAVKGCLGLKVAHHYS